MRDLILGTPPRRRSPIAFGLTIGNHPTMAAATWDAAVARWGRVPAFYTWYHNLSTDGWYSSYATWCRDRGMTPVVTLEFDNSGVVVLDDIIAGTWDTAIDNYGAGLHGWLAGKPEAIVVLRPLHEGNGDWYDWGIGLTGNSAADYIAAWQRIHTRIMAAGNKDSQIRFLWTPNAGTANIASIYPGDAYVDYVGLDGYNWGSYGGNTWATFQSVFDHATQGYDKVYEAAAATKPFVIGEYGLCSSTYAGANSLRGWVRDMYEALAEFPMMRGLLYFDVSTDAGWIITSDAEKQAALRDFASRLTGRLS